jgi:MerR family transcriptional regulator, light-induced transcriptional regulator
MYHFTIRDIENLCGIKAHTLRVWEQRYQFFTPKRKESKHRLYDNEDLKQLLRIAFLYQQGWKISKIAQLSPEQVLTEIAQFNPGTDNYQYFINRLLECAIDFEKDGFLKELQNIIEKTGFEACIAHVCYPLLQKIGMLWMTNHVIPAQEHFCSYLIQHKIIAETEKLEKPNGTATEIILFCPHGEYHELPLYFINYLLRKRGWSTFFLGSNVSLNLLEQFASRESVQYLFLHVITNFTGFTMDDYFEKLCLTFRDKKIIASGTSVFGLQRNFTNLTLLKSDKEIYQFIQTYVAT